MLLAGVCVLFLVKRAPRPAASPHLMIRVEVLNGCEEPGLAGRCSEFLQRQGYDVVHTGNAGGFSFTESIVLDRAGALQKATEIGQVLGIPNVIQQINTDPYRREEVTVIMGRDHYLLTPGVGRQGR